MVRSEAASALKTRWAKWFRSTMVGTIDFGGVKFYRFECRLVGAYEHDNDTIGRDSEGVYASLRCN